MIAEMMKLTVDLNKPIYIGQAVLDLSKLTIFKLRYEELPKYEDQFGGTISVLGGDTDSLICAVSNINLEQLHRQMVENELLDTSNYPHDHIYSVSDSRLYLAVSRTRLEGAHF